VLRELIATEPNELAPVFKLAALQEHQQEIDAAEHCYPRAARLPDSQDPYIALMQFYSRRSVALQPVTMKDVFADSPKSGRRRQRHLSGGRRRSATETDRSSDLPA